MLSATKCRNLKMVLVGDMAVGKTSLANVFVNETFRDKYSASIGGHFMAKTLEKPYVTLQIWDTAGMERFRSMLPHFMRDAVCAFIVYDVTQRESFMSVRDYWTGYVDAAATQKNLVKVLVGNKVDLIESKAVKTSEGQNLADLHGMLFIETSAKAGINVDTMFIAGATAVIKAIPETVVEENGIRLEQLGHKKSRSKCCSSS